MLQSQLFTKTQKMVSGGETSVNAQLLIRGGFVYKNSAGVYSYLPLGLRVIEKINKIIKEEMNAIGGVEVLMPALVDRKYLEATDRFKLDVGFDVFGKGEKKAKYSLGWTHEEVLTAIVSRYINSYKDLPKYIYQIQTKFRNEPRAKSGLLRGIEFLMKDLYSFHTSEEDLFEYYDNVREAYFKVFERCGLESIYTLAAGGDFTMSNTHEFQVLADVGEDIILYCEKCKYAENEEISKLKDGSRCPKCKGKIIEAKSIEVGNIFPLGTKYSEAMDLNFQDAKGKKSPVVMGSYGIGVSRLLGTIVELYHDDNGMMWPKEVAPFNGHIVSLFSGNEKVKKEADTLYKLLQKSNFTVLYDDRENVSAGEKFADSDLLGLPIRMVVSPKTLGKGIEVKHRNKKDAQIMEVDEFLKKFKICSTNYSVISQKTSG